MDFFTGEPMRLIQAALETKTVDTRKRELRQSIDNLYND